MRLFCARRYGSGHGALGQRDLGIPAHRDRQQLAVLVRLGIEQAFLVGGNTEFGENRALRPAPRVSPHRRFFLSVHCYPVRHTETLGQFGEALVQRPQRCARRNQR